MNLQQGAEPPKRGEILGMLGALPHRGPDESGVYRDSDAALGHARLSIIDVSSGQQPLCNEDGSLFITFNGEIFNYVELAEELAGHGHEFRTKSDTEVILHAYEQWGDQAFGRMNGQWALAIWDARRKRLVLSRDRLGIQPLYVTAFGGRLYFASEVKALFAANDGMERRFDPIGFEQTFTFWTVVPPACIFANVEELRPGTVRIHERGRVVDRAFWQPEYPDRRSGAGAFVGSLEAAAGAVRESIEEAVRLRMLRSDVPVGSYLSGGLDSTFVAALARRHAGDRFHTFSLRFEDDEYDEGAYQRLARGPLESDHHEVVVTKRDIARVFPEVVRHAERPLLRTAPAPLWLLSSLVRDTGIKVVLTGEGADEMFAGYDLFREGKVRRFWAKHPESTLRPRLIERLYPYLARSPVSAVTAGRFFGRGLGDFQRPGFAHSTRWESTSALKRLFSAPFRAAVGSRDVVAELLEATPHGFSSWTPLAQDQFLETRALLSGYLLASQGDRMLMAHSVEGRFPFLDRDVVTLANSLPDHYKLRVLDEKHVLKRAAGDLVPESILGRKKQPYVGTDADYVDDVLSDRAIADCGVFEPAVVQKLLRKCRARTGRVPPSNTDNMGVVAVISTQLLHEQLIRCRPSIAPVTNLRTDIDRAEGGR